jgi:hypothetical protein
MSPGQRWEPLRELEQLHEQMRQLHIDVKAA